MSTMKIGGAGGAGQSPAQRRKKKRKIHERRHMKVKAFFVPYYFCVMNYAVYAGFLRYCKGSQSVLWEKAKRAQ